MDRKVLMSKLFNLLSTGDIYRGLHLIACAKAPMDDLIPILRWLYDNHFIVISGNLASAESAEDAFFSAAPKLIRCYDNLHQDIDSYLKQIA